MIEDMAVYPSEYHTWETFVLGYLDRLKASKVFIFGAGVRGSALLRVLRIFQIPEIFFVDNSPEKQGTEVDGYPVLGFREAASEEHRVFLCPNRGGGSILSQLSEAGLKEKEDFFDLDVPQINYLRAAEELQKPMEGPYSLIMGPCTFASMVLGERAIPPLGETLREGIFGRQSRLVDLPGLLPGMYYHTLNTLDTRGEMLRCVFLNIDLSILAPYFSMYMGSAVCREHRLLLEKLLESAPKNEAEIREYMEILEKRRKRMEALEGTVSTVEGDFVRDTKRVYEMEYLYRPRQNDESFMYMEKILSRLNKGGVPVILLFPPIDYMRGETLFGDEFKAHITAMKERILSFWEPYAFEFLDATFLVTMEGFVPETKKPDINPFLNERGQKELMSFLARQACLQQFMSQQGSG